MQHLELFLPTRLVFGAGRAAELPQHLQHLELTAQRILVVTDPGASGGSGALDLLHRQLAGRAVEVFLQVEPNPSLATIEEGCRLARQAGSQLVIGLGGGSPMDAAKGIALLAANQGSLAHYLDGERLAVPPLPVICLPTTSGTGSEVTPFAVFTDPDNGSKRGYANPQLFPILSIVDPELTYSMPQQVTIDTGLDVLTHAVEAHLSTEATPLSDLFALQAIEITLTRLEQAARSRREAMSDMAYAATLAGIAIAHAGTILLHVMGYPLTVFKQVPHGRANAALLPAFLDFMQRRSTVADRVAKIGQRFQYWGSATGFVNSLGVATDLASYGVGDDDLDLFVDRCVVKDDLRITPAEVTGERIRGIYRAAL